MEDIIKKVKCKHKFEYNEDIAKCLICGKEIKLGFCSHCNKNVIIYSTGMCKSRYNYIHRNKEKNVEYYSNWKKKNPNYFKEYYAKHKLVKDGINI